MNTLEPCLTIIARQNSGKTETIKERSIYVYLPSIEMIEDQYSIDSAFLVADQLTTEQVEEKIESSSLIFLTV